MSDDANRLIDQLFDRIKEAEKQTGERDSHAEAHINKRLVQQPSAPYYMAQTIIMQEAALKRLHSKVTQLEKKQAEKPSSGGFLSGLFGHEEVPQDTATKTQSGWGNGSASQGRQGFSQNTAQAQGQSNQGQSNQGQSNQGQSSSSGRGFLGGALQTAAGVAGGVVVGSMLMNMFGHHTPSEMADAVQEEPTEQGFSSDSMGQDEMNQNDFANNDLDSTGADQGGFGQAGFEQNNGFGQSGFEQSSFIDTNSHPVEDGFSHDGDSFDGDGGFDEDFDI